MLIKEKLENGDFSNSERVIVDYILENKMVIKDMTTKEIANATFTSPSTLIRIAHKMNYKGWNELKEAYLNEVEYLESHFDEIDANFPFQNDDTIMSIASKLAELKQEALQDTLALVRHDDLQKAVQIIRKVDTIYVFAVSNNGLICQEFAHNMMRIGKKVITATIQGELVFQAINADSNSCAIILSYSGETPVLLRALQALKANQIPVIGITSIGENSLSKGTDVNMRICTREKLFSKIATFSTDVSFEYVLDLLYSCTFSLNYNQNVKRKIMTSRMIEKGRFSTLDILKEDEF